MRHLVVIEETDTGFSAYLPDLDGCITTGSTKEEVERNMREAMEFHLEGMRWEKQETPKPHSYSSCGEVMA